MNPDIQPDSANQGPIPFEDLKGIQGFWKRVSATFHLAFSEPMSFYERIRNGETLMAPWRFTMLMSLPLYLFLLIYALIGIVLLLAAASGPANHQRMPFLILGACLVAFPLLVPLFQLVWMLIGGAINHAFLWLWGGTRNSAGLHQTIRATGYTHAFVNLLALIPFVGLLVVLASPVFLGIGLARLHRTDTWRGVCAMLTPLILCLCLFIGSVAMVLSWALRQAEKDRYITLPPATLEPSSPKRDFDPESKPPRACARLALESISMSLKS